MPPTGQYNIFELTTGSVVGISTTATVGVSTTSVIGLTTTSVVGLSTSGGNAPVTMGIPPSADVVAGSLLSSTGTLIAIPANRTWFGSLSVTAAAQSTYGSAALNASAAINTLGGTVTPAAGAVLTATVSLGNTVGLTTTSATSPSAFGNNTASLHNVCIAVGSSSATLTLTRVFGSAGGTYTASATGWLL